MREPDCAKRFAVQNLSARRRALAWEAGVSGGYKTLLAYAPGDGRAVVLLNNTDMQQSEQARTALALPDALDN